MTDPHAPESRPGGILASCTSGNFPAPRRAPELYVAQTTGVLGRCIRIPLTQYIPRDAPNLERELNHAR